MRPPVRFRQLIGAVLNEFDQLPMRITAARGVLFLIGLFFHQGGLSTIGIQCRLRLAPDVLADPTAGADPGGVGHAAPAPSFHVSASED